MSTPYQKLEVAESGSLEVWLPAFQLSMLDILAFCEIEVSSPYQKLEVPESGSTLYQLCIVLASFPSLRCNFRKKHVSHSEKQSVWWRSCSLQDSLQYSACALSCAVRPLQSNEGLPAFQLPMYSMWRTAEKRFVRHVCPGIHASCEIQASTPSPEAWGPWERQRAPPASLWLHHPCKR